MTCNRGNILLCDSTILTTMILTRDLIIEKLRACEFDALIGSFENETLECKREPYVLTTDRQKLELVKDVCGFANAQGGLLLIGYATQHDPMHGDDRIASVTPFPSSRINAQQVKDTIASWTWPPLAVEIEIFPLHEDTERSIALITVPATGEDARPTLVVRVLSESDRRIETILGYFERTRSHTHHLDARRVHELIVSGRRYDGLLHGELASIKVAIAELKPASATKPPIDDQTRLARVALALSAVQLNLEPHIVLTGIPHVSLDLRSLFESRASRLAKLVSYPPKLRESGFGIDAGYHARIEGGQSLRAMEPQSRLLELYRDGFALFALSGGGQGLCWATHGHGELVINQLALVEITYLFARFIFEAYESALKPGERFDARIQLQSREGYLELFRLQAHHLGGRGKFYTAPAWRREVSVTATFGTDTPERVAFNLLMDLYTWFGMDGDQIPYVKRDERGNKEIDPDSIRSAL